MHCLGLTWDPVERLDRLDVPPVILAIAVRTARVLLLGRAVAGARLCRAHRWGAMVTGIGQEQ